MTEFNDNRITAIGHRHIWGGSEPFGLRRADLRQHVYVLGKSGTGKSSLLRNLIVQSIQAGEGVSLIDPHGDLADELLDYIPPWRTDHLVLVAPGDLDHPVAYNILAGAKPDEIPLIASGIVSCFRAIYANSWGPRLDLLLFASVFALAECCLKTGNATILGIPRMLTDRDYREWVLTHVSDVSVKSFWLTEYAAWDKRFMMEAISPVTNKIQQLLMSPALRNMVGNTRKSFDLRFILDHDRIFIANLSKGRIGQDKANLLGALLIAQFEQAALSRANVPSEKRKDHLLVVDEVQNYPVEALPRILAEARKYKLAVVTSNQHTTQLPPEFRDAIFGNCGTLISFRVGEKDAALLSKEFGGAYAAEQFTDLSNFEVFVKLLDEGRHPEPFRGTTLPPFGQFHGRRANLITRSRQRYSSPRAVIESKIQRWMKGT